MNIISVISPLIFIAYLGFLCAKSQWLNKNQLNGISKLTFNLCIPVFLFSKMATANFNQQLELSFFLSFYIPVLLCYFFAWFINQFFHPRYNHNYQASAVFALGSSYSNNVIIGLPILMMIYGEKVVVLIFAIVIFHSALLFTLTALLAAKKTKVTQTTESVKDNHKNILLQTFKNPLLVGIIMGVLVNVSTLTLPKFMTESLLLLGKPAITFALFVLGASLTFYRVKIELTFVVISTAIKLILLPSLVFLTANYGFHLDKLSLNVLVILSACPTGVNAYLMAQNFNKHQETVASTVMVTTILAILSLSFWLWWLN